MPKLTHLNKKGEARMVDVSAKAVTHRVAVAEGCIRMKAATLRRVQTAGHKKGDVLAVARVAGIMAAKQTSELIPLCHPLSLTRVEIELTPEKKKNAVHCRASVETDGKTGVEMEALLAVEIALLTIYDMCKAVDRGMTINGVRLLEKSGGRSGIWRRRKN
ncbi:MAG TPA: cyclic pyranopterin monophosphate synthase MoaC [Gammaproteobacteria bacterium]|nr:cyclic pyranopterin monophosphate synthase MoaC [Gammaproteobacteria bacterium]